MVEQIVVEKWLYETLNAGVPTQNVFVHQIPREHAKPAIVFTQVSTRDILVQQKERHSVEMEYDVFAYSARGVRSMPHETAMKLDTAINTDEPVVVEFVDANVTSRWEITCDRIMLRSFGVNDDAGDYMVSGGRYSIRVQKAV